MSVYRPASGSKGRPFESWALNRWIFNFRIRSTPLRFNTAGQLDYPLLAISRGFLTASLAARMQRFLFYPRHVSSGAIPSTSQVTRARVWVKSASDSELGSLREEQGDEEEQTNHVIYKRWSICCIGDTPSLGTPATGSRRRRS